MPRTLLARLFLLLAVVMTLSALAWAAVFTFSEREPRARHFAQLLTSVANLTRVAVLAADPAQRTDLLNELSNREGIRIDIADDAEPVDPTPLDPFLGSIQEKLKETLGPRTQLLMTHKGEQAIFLRVPIAGDDYWIILPRERLMHSHAPQWIGWGLLAAAIAFLAAGIFVSRLTLPLRKIAGAAREIGAGHHPPPIPEDGADELKDVARAFNQMNTDLARLDQDRALVLAGISHDLRTPLARLRLGLEMSLDDGELKEGMSADIDEMDRTIGQFLDFARADSREAPETTSIGELIESLAEHYRRRGIPLQTEIAPVAPRPLHAQLLRRAIGNLIDNALRHGGPAQDIRIVVTETAESLLIEIQDRGPGIPESEIERVKRPFARLEQARSNTGGSGLGLAIVEKVALQHGGSLVLNNREGGGLCARVRIPRP